MSQSFTTRELAPGVPPTPLLRTLGATSLLAHAGPGAAILDLQPKRLALLVFLARARRTGPVRRDLLLAYFWPESEEIRARAVLRQALSSLRKQLGPDAILAHGEEDISLAPDAVTCDATEFEAACDAGALDAALQLYAGEFLAGFHAADVAPEFEHWVDAERARLRRLAGDAARRAAAMADEARTPAVALRWAWRAIEVEPDNEAGVARLIALLDAQGDRAGALRVYRELEQRLAREFAAEPSPETRALIKTLRDRPTPAGAPQPVVPKESPLLGAAPDAAGALPASTARSHKRTMLAVAAAAVAAVTVALTASSGRQRAAPDLATHPAVAPFRLHVSDSSLGWLAEAIPELLADRLSATLPSRLVVEGSASGTPGHLVLSARLPTGTAGLGPAATSSGPLDSLGAVIDDLARQLLAHASGLDAQQVGSLRGVPSSALMPYLAGRAELREGRADVAVRYFSEALAADSTFALAALGIARVGIWPGTEVDEGPAVRLARAHRARLTPADQALLDVVGGEWISSPDRLRALHAGVAAFPWRAEMWYYLGDGWLHFGRLAGFPDALTRAEEALRRGWVLDSAANGGVPLRSPLLAEPALHLVELAHIRGDSAEVLRLAGLIVQADSTSDLAAEARWHAAVFQGKEALRGWWSRRRDMSHRITQNLVLFILGTGLGSDDSRRAGAEDTRRLLTYDPGYRDHALYMKALNAGRPSELPSRADDAEPRIVRLQKDIRAARWWGLDSAAGESAARELARLAARPPLTGAAGVRQDQVVCTLASLRASRGESESAARAADRLRGREVRGVGAPDSAKHVGYLSLCAALIDAQVATSLGDPMAPDKVMLADSLARANVYAICCGSAPIGDANLILARLWEDQGQPRQALAAARRRGARFLRGPSYLSVHLRTEGRLALATGDTAGAIRAWRHYLTIRPAPEHVAAAEVDSVRRSLNSLLAR